MPDGRDAIAVRVVDRIAQVPATQWDRCLDGVGLPHNPFLSHAFLLALEESGSATAEAGWQPHHLVIEDDDGVLLGAAPLYLKNHSQGEYVFDHSWAHAYERAGGRYYPKLQCAVPFSPVTGPRLLVRDDDPTADLSPQTVRSALAGGFMEATRQLDLSSLHVTFCTQEDADFLEAAGFLVRLSHQFHWHNRGYASFDDFLGDMTSRKRKSIRRERRKVSDAGIHVQALTGDDIKPRHWDAFYRFYIDTYDRKWGYPYLTREFFETLQSNLAHRVVLVMAEIEGQPIAGAFNMLGDDALFGRNWGCDIRYKFLHFEACYYSAIDFAITHGLSRVEAGTRGPHKLQRGYLPVRTYSAHWIPDSGFRRAVAEFLRQETHAVEDEITEIADFSPFKAGSGRAPDNGT